MIDDMMPMEPLVLHQQLPPVTTTRQRKRKSTEENSIVKLSRKRTPKLTIYDKVRIILASKNEKKSYREIREIYRCSKSTISSIMDKSSQILEKASQLTEIQSKQRCRIKQEAHYPEIEKGLFLWLNHPNIKALKLSDKAIRDKAKDEFFRVYGKEWKPSAGWLVGFKARCKKKDFLNSVSQPDISHQAFGMNGEPDSKPARWIEKMKERTIQMQNQVVTKSEGDDSAEMDQHEHEMHGYMTHHNFSDFYTNIPRQTMLPGMITADDDSTDED